jgi:hypothetical protein
MSPQKIAMMIEIIYESKTVYEAYPAANAANSPVKNMVAPMPMYLLVSTGVLFNILGCAPEQNRKKLFKEFIK